MLEIVRFEVRQPVGDGRVGEVLLTVRRHPVANAHQAGRLEMRSRPHSHGATGSLSFLPYEPDRLTLIASPPTPEGYEQTAPLPASDIELRLAVVSMGAEVGKVFDFELYLVLDADQRRRARVREGVEVSLYVEARPEVYLALGLAERVRSIAQSAYTELTQAGREAHKRRGTSLPSTPTDPIADALSRTSMDWALQMIEVGTRVYRTRVDHPPPDAPDGRRRGGRD